MSDHEESYSSVGYGAPFTRLDATRTHIQDGEDISVDVEDGGIATEFPRHPRSSSEARSISPPNSVKAFAEARRRGREASIPVPRTVEREEGLGLSAGDGGRIPGYEPASNATKKDAEGGLCYLVPEDLREHKLYIDFDCLETLAKSRSGITRPETIDIAPLLAAKEDFENIASHDSLPTEEQQPDPNRFSFFSSAWETTIHASRFGGLVLPGEDIRALFNTSGQGDGVWWLNMDNPAKEEIRLICKGFGIHPLTIEDIIAQENREKIELFPSYYFACFRSFRHSGQQDGIHYVPFNIYVVVFREGTLSFSFAPNTHAALVRARISRLKEFVSLSSDWICYALIDDIVDSFAPAINQVELESDTIEDQVLVARSDDNQELFRRIGKARKNITGLMRLLGGKADVLRGFTKRCNENYKVTPRMDIALYLGDIRDHVITMMNNLFHFEKMLSRTQGNYLAQLSIDNITQGNRTNEGLTRVTVIATVLVPLNVVCGLFGMNVRVPWRDDDNLNAFLGITGGIIICAATCLLVARRMRYL